MPNVRELYETVTKQSPRQPNALDRQLARQARTARNRKLGAVAVAVALVAGLAMYAVLQVASTRVQSVNHGPTPVATTNVGIVTITHAGCTLTGETSLDAGPFTLSVANASQGSRDVKVFKVASDASFGRLIAFVTRAGLSVRAPFQEGGYKGDLEPWMEFGWSIQTRLDPHGSSTLSGALDPGTYGIRCTGRAHPVGLRPTDFIGPIDVR